MNNQFLDNCVNMFENKAQNIYKFIHYVIYLLFATIKKINMAFEN